MHRILYSILICCFVQSTSAQCNAIITPSGPTIFCDGNSVELTGSPGDTYQWYLNGTSINGETNIAYIASAPGSYTVETDSAGCVSMSAPVVVTVNTVPAQPGAISGDGTYCNNELETFSVNAVPDATSYSWTIAGAPLPGNTNTIQYMPVWGQIQLAVTANNACGSSPASGALGFYTTLAPNNTTLHNVQDNSICTGESVDIALVTHYGSQTFKWYRDNVYVGSNHFYSATVAGAYYVEVISQGCTATSATQVIYVTALPQPVVIQYGPSIGTTQAYASHHWYFNGAFIPGSNNQYYHPTQDGDYKVRVFDGNGCDNESAVFHVGFTDVNHVVQKDILSLYPLPNNGSFTLSANIPITDKYAGITIIDITGKQIINKHIVVENGTIEEQIELDANIAPGLYFLKLSSPGFNKVISFVKQ